MEIVKLYIYTFFTVEKSLGCIEERMKNKRAIPICAEHDCG
jgi:hypothetical protein